MSATGYLNRIRSQSITKLVLNNELRGFRVKRFNGTSFEYYDFTLAHTREVPDVYEFMTDYLDKFKETELVEKDGVLYTQEELDGKFDILELQSDRIFEVLAPVKQLYERGEVVA